LGTANYLRSFASWALARLAVLSPTYLAVAPTKRSFEDKRVPKLELGNEESL
jgi:hypothetical protein